MNMTIFSMSNGAAGMQSRRKLNCITFCSRSCVLRMARRSALKQRGSTWEKGLPLLWNKNLEKFGGETRETSVSRAAIITCAWLQPTLCTIPQQFMHLHRWVQLTPECRRAPAPLTAAPCACPESLQIYHTTIFVCYREAKKRFQLQDDPLAV
jgi:hypothetical protein